MKKIIVNRKQDDVLGECYEVVLEPALAAASYVSVCPKATREHVEQLRRTKGYKSVEDNAGLFKARGPLELAEVETMAEGRKKFTFRGMAFHVYAEACMQGGNLVIESCTFPPPSENYAQVRHLLLEYYGLETSSVQTVIPTHGGHKKFIFSHGPGLATWAIANAHGAMVESELPVGSPRRLTQARLISEYFKNGITKKPTVCVDKPVGYVTQGGPQAQVVAVFINADGFYVNASPTALLLGESLGELNRVNLMKADKWRLTNPERQIPIFRKRAKAAGLGVVFLKELVDTTYEFYESFGVEELAQPIPPAPKAEETEGARIEVQIYKKKDLVEIFFEQCELIPDLEHRLIALKRFVGRAFRAFTSESPLFSNTLIVRCERYVAPGRAETSLEAAFKKHFEGVPFEIVTVNN